MNSKYEAVVGLEVHAQLLTESKIFCGCSTKSGSDPNANTCPICLGHPGVLPVLNKKAVEYTSLMGLATNCRINEFNLFLQEKIISIPICQKDIKFHNMRNQSVKMDL